jgi:dihydroorotate dehydrogenase (NAD+) catalytic subunit
VRLSQELFGAQFQNPALLAAGTCGFGEELSEVVDLDALGGFVTKSVTLEPRRGNPAPRVAEFAGGMLNSVGLANPGLEATLRDKLPWIAANVRRAQVLISLAGHTVEEFFRLVEGLDGSGLPRLRAQPLVPERRQARGASLRARPGCRGRDRGWVPSATERPLVAKLAPNDPSLGRTVRDRDRDAGADGLTLVNTIPGLLLLPETGDPELGAGPGGVSGPALQPLGERAVEEARRHTTCR